MENRGGGHLKATKKGRQFRIKLVPCISFYFLPNFPYVHSNGKYPLDMIRGNGGYKGESGSRGSKDLK